MDPVNQGINWQLPQAELSSSNASASQHHQKLMAALLDSGDDRSTAVTAPKHQSTFHVNDRVEARSTQV